MATSSATPAPAAASATPPARPPRSGSPEALDQVTETTTPRGWWALGAVIVIVVAALIWSIVATIPQQVSGTGVVSSFNYSSTVAAPVAGVVKFEAAVDKSVEPDSVIATVTPFGGGTPVPVTAGLTGSVNGIYVSDGEGVEAGESMATVVVSPDPQKGIIVGTFVPAADAMTYFVGQTAQVSVTDLALSQTSVATATITDVANSPSSLDGMANFSGSETIAQSWMTAADGTPYRILLNITDWPEGDTLVPAPGEVVTIVNTYGSVHPIELLFGGN